MYTSSYVEYTIMNEHFSLDNYTENKEWHLDGYNAIKYEVVYEHWYDKQKFSEIRYQILMSRKSLFVLQNYVIGAILLCILTLVSFFIPLAQCIILFYLFEIFYYLYIYIKYISNANWNQYFIIFCSN
jgi:hypothetical protein